MLSDNHDDQDVSLTHVADTGLLLSSTDQLQFGDSGTYIHQSADGVLDLVSDSEIEINATTIDINGAVEMSGVVTVATGIIADAHDGAYLGSLTKQFPKHSQKKQTPRSGRGNVRSK